jgi:hypothetical protein
MTSFSAYVPSGTLLVTVFVGDSIVSNDDAAKIELRRELVPGTTHYFKIQGTENSEVRGLQVIKRILNVIKEVSPEQANEEMAALEMVAVR